MYIRIGGVAFDPSKAFINLKPDKVFAKGEILHGKTIDYPSAHIRFSDGGVDDSNGQIEDAIRFLEKNQQELTRLANINSVEYFDLDFGFGYPGATFAHFHRLPSQLLQLAGTIGLSIAVSCYAVEEQ